MCVRDDNYTLRYYYTLARRQVVRCIRIRVRRTGIRIVLGTATAIEVEAEVRTRRNASPRLTTNKLIFGLFPASRPPKITPNQS